MLTLFTLGLALASGPETREDHAAPTGPAHSEVQGTTNVAPQLQEVVDLVELGRHVPNVVRGEVLQSVAHVDGHGIQTQYKIAVFDVVTGQAPEILSLWLPGGSVDQLQMKVDGVPHWKEGDDVVLFLRDDGRVPYLGMFTLEHGVLLDAYGRRGVGLKALAGVSSASHTPLARN